MDFDFSDLMSSITLLVSIVSPVAVAFINARHAEKLEIIRAQEEERHRAVSEYIRCAGAAITSLDDEVMENYRKSYGAIYLYAPKDLWVLIEILDSDISRLHSGAASQVNRQDSLANFSEICQKLSFSAPRNGKSDRKRNVK